MQKCNCEQGIGVCSPFEFGVQSTTCYPQTEHTKPAVNTVGTTATVEKS